MAFSEAKLERYGDVLLWGLRKARKTAFRKRDVVMVRYHLPALSLAEVLQARLLDMGLNPVLRLASTPRMERSLFRRANHHQLTFHPPGEKELFQKLNGAVYLHAPESLTHLSDVDPRRIGKAALSAKPLRDILDKRDDKGLFGWTLCMMPTPELARQSGLSMKRYEAQVLRACYLDRPDPVGSWETVYRQAREIKKWLNAMDVSEYRVESEHMDIRISPGEKRRWIGISGHNIPSFEIFLSPDWRGTEGTYYANQPSFRSGNYVEGVRLVFRKGKVVSAEAEKGRDFLVKQLAMDPGAGRVGEFSLTDRRFSPINRFMANTLYDENYGGRQGNCHLALGASYSDTYRGDPSGLTKQRKVRLGFNDSALHWDLVNTEKKSVTARLRSGKVLVVYENGRFAC